MQPRPLLATCVTAVLIAGIPLPHLVLAAENDASNVSFRKPTADLVALQPGAPAPVQAQVQVEGEDLEEKKETLEGELRFATSKLEAAQKKLATENAVEETDRLRQEVQDWEARIRVTQSQLAQVNQELAANEAPEAQALIGGPETDIIVPGENLEIFVVQDPSFNGRYQVRRGGYIIMPQVGRISIAGKSLGGAEASVRKALEASQLRKASVMIERISGADVEAGPLIYLSGEFRSPRPYRIPAGTSPTLVSVILSSGGVTDKGDLTRVRVMRMAANRGVVEEVNVQRILDGGGLTSDISLSEGDVVTIPVGQSNLIYVTGNVKRQGSYHLTPGERLSAYGAILQSGGFSRFANLKKVHVLRAMPDGTKAKLPVNVVAIQRGEQPDVPLQSNDIIVIPEKFFSF